MHNQQWNLSAAKFCRKIEHIKKLRKCKGTHFLTILRINFLQILRFLRFLCVSSAQVPLHLNGDSFKRNILFIIDYPTKSLNHTHVTLFLLFAIFSPTLTWPSCHGFLWNSHGLWSVFPPLKERLCLFMQLFARINIHYTFNNFKTMTKS